MNAQNKQNAYGDDNFSNNQEEDESSSAESDVVQDALYSFRENWDRELKLASSSNKATDKIEIETVNERSCEIETKAKTFFMNGVALEKAGKFYEAVQFYRRAVQLEPNIEHKINNYKFKTFDYTLNEKGGDDLLTEVDSDNDNSDDEDFSGNELLSRIQKKIEKTSRVCVPKKQQNTTHISALPTEMILYILKWVVSSDLDMRSLEMCSMVCRGFYLCARDPEIWRLACLKVWNLNCGSSPNSYLTWRSMYIERIRLLFNGCYIGKITYIRNGENSFQDKFYRPWHLITYYRYIRFFPEGIVLVLTSPDEPSQCVGQLTTRNAKAPVLRGYYRLNDDKVFLVIKRQQSKNQGCSNKNKRKDNSRESSEQTFHMELQINNTNKGKYAQLSWTYYSVCTRTMRGDENTSNFDVVGTRFPPFRFSRVKSYSLEAENPLF